jgi:hypothetical protein
MKNFYLFLFFLVISIELNAQDWLWINTFNHEKVSLEDMYVDDEGSIYVTGRHDFPLTLGDTTLTSNRDQDGLMAKYKNCGSLDWVNSTGTIQSSDRFRTVSVGKNKNVYAIGAVAGGIVDLGNGISVNEHTPQMYFAQYDTAGTINKLYFNTGLGNCYSRVKTDSDDYGNAYFIGEYTQPITFLGVNVPFIAHDILIASFDTSGSLKWWKNLGGSNAIDFLDSHVDGEGNIYITLTYQNDYTIDGYTYYSNNYYNQLMVKLDDLGNIIWHKSIPSNSENIGWELDVYEDVIYLAGHFSGDLYIGNDTITSQGLTAGYVARYDTSGHLLWYDIQNGGNSPKTRDVHIIDKNNILVIGNFSDSVTISNQVLYCQSYRNGFMYRMDSTGNISLLEQITCSPTSSVYLKNIAGNDDGSIYIQGVFGGVLSDTMYLGDITSSGHNINSVFFFAKYGDCFAPSVSVLTSDTVTICSNGQTNIELSSNAPCSQYTWYRNNTLVGANSNGILTASQTGNYYAVVNNESCKDTSGSVYIQHIPSVDIISSVSNVSCNGYNNGRVGIDFDTTNNYSFLWNTNDTSASLNNLDTGIYEVLITNLDNNCSATEIYQIYEPDSLILNTVSDNISCFGMSDGSITTTVSGGTSNYTYTWNTGDTSASLNNLDTGTYTLVVMDANSCLDSSTQIISQPDTIKLSATAISDTNNIGLGIATIHVLGGTPNYYFQWHNANSIDSVAYNLSFGNYLVTVIDAKNCTDTITVNINNIVNSVSKIEILNNIKIYPNPSNGYFQLNYEIEYAHASTIEIFDVLGQRIIQKTIPRAKNVQENIDLANYPSGTYWLSITIDNSKMSFVLIKE